MDPVNPMETSRTDPIVTNRSSNTIHTNGSQSETNTNSYFRAANMNFIPRGEKTQK